MAGENAARLMRDRAAQLARRTAREMSLNGNPTGADAMRDLAVEIDALPVGGN